MFLYPVLCTIDMVFDLCSTSTLIDEDLISISASLPVLIYFNAIYFCTKAHVKMHEEVVKAIVL